MRAGISLQKPRGHGEQSMDAFEQKVAAHLALYRLLHGGVRRTRHRRCASKRIKIDDNSVRRSQELGCLPSDGPLGCQLRTRCADDGGSGMRNMDLPVKPFACSQ